MNNIAVCFFGQFRGDSETFNSIFENIVKPNNADVYIHTWSYHDKSYVFENPNVDYTSDDQIYVRRQIFTNETFNEFREIFKPKRIFIDEQIIFDNTQYVSINPQNLNNDWPKSESTKCTAHGARLYQGMKSMALSKKRSFGLLEDKNKYDFIILVRNDIFFKFPKCFTELETNNNEIFLYNINDQYVSDLVFAGTPDVIEKLVSFYEVSDDFYINKNQGWTCEFNERHMKNYIKELGLSIKHYDFIDYDFQSIVKYSKGML
jgi:hypothetical protein